MDKLVKRHKIKNGILVVLMGVLALILFSVYIETNTKRNSTSFLLIISIVFLGVMLLFLYRTIRKPELYKGLAKGRAELSGVNEDMKHPIVEEKQYSIGETYLVSNRAIDLKHAVVNMNRVAWAYKSITQHRYYGIPTGKTFKLAVYEEGINYLKEIVISEQQVDALLDYLRNRNPIIVIGYRPEWVKIWADSRTIEDFYQQVITLSDMSN